MREQNKKSNINAKKYPNVRRLIYLHYLSLQFLIFVVKELPTMEFLSTLQIDLACYNDLKETLLLEYGLIIRLISETSHSFERALSICLFGNEEETESISSTLNSHFDW